MDGTPYYSVPIIHDPKTGTSVGDSLWIAEYLDGTYPETPRIVPPGGHALHMTFLRSFGSLISDKHRDVLSGKQASQFNEGSAEWFWWNKMKWAEKDLGTEDEKFAAIEQDLQPMERWYKQGDKFLTGSDDLILADLHIAGWLGWVRTLWGEDSEQWQKVLAWNGGRWKALFEKLAPYEQVVI